MHSGITADALGNNAARRRGDPVALAGQSKGASASRYPSDALELIEEALVAYPRRIAAPAKQRHAMQLGAAPGRPSEPRPGPVRARQSIRSSQPNCRIHPSA